MLISGYHLMCFQLCGNIFGAACYVLLGLSFHYWVGKSMWFGTMAVACIFTNLKPNSLLAMLSVRAVLPLVACYCAFDFSQSHTIAS